MYSHLAPLNLADTHQGDTPIEVDMLIGSDFYWQLTTKEIIRGQVGCHQHQAGMGTIWTSEF